MKNKKMFRKGFTLVELIVVIAIIAILAAVSAVSYIAFINQANESADQQAVTQMNTALQAGEASGKPKNIAEVYESLTANGMEGKDYKPLYKDRYFFWDSSINRIVYTDKDYKVSYPDKYVNQAQDNFFSLSGEIPTVELDSSKITGTENNKTATVSTAAELAGLVDQISSKGITTIQATGKLNMQGAQLSFGTVKIGSQEGCLPSDLTLKGTAGNPLTLSNIVNSISHVAKTDIGTNKQYGGSIFGTIYDNKKLTLENVVIDNACIGNYSGCIGILIDTATGKSTVDLKNVTIQNSVLYGQNKVGIICGAFRADQCTTSATDIKVSNWVSYSENKVKLINNTVYTNEGEAGIVAGFVFKNASTDNQGDWNNNAEIVLKTLISNTEITNCKVEYVEYLNHKITANNVSYSTKHDNNTPLRMEGDLVRLSIVPSVDTLYSLPQKYSPRKTQLEGVTYDNMSCSLDYNEKNVTSVS